MQLFKQKELTKEQKELKAEKAFNRKIKIAKIKHEINKIAIAVIITQYIIATILFLGVKYGAFDFLQPKTTIIYINHAEASEIVKSEVKQDIQYEDQEIIDLIWLRESSKGVNNYSKCKAINQYNEIGYAIPGDGSYICFESRQEQFNKLQLWIDEHQEQGLSYTELLCHYSGNHYKECL